MSENQASPVVSPSPSKGYPTIPKTKSALEQMWFYLPRVLTFGFAIALFAGVESFSTVLLAVIGVYFALAAVLVVFIVSPQEVKSFKNLLQGVQPIQLFTQQVKHSTNWLDARFGPPCSWQAFGASYVLALNYPLLLLIGAWLFSGNNEFFGGSLFYDAPEVWQRVGRGLSFFALLVTGLYCFSSNHTHKTTQLYIFSIEKELLGLLGLLFVLAAFLSIIPLANVLTIFLATLLFIVMVKLISNGAETAVAAVAVAAAAAVAVAVAVAVAAVGVTDTVALAAFAFAVVFAFAFAVVFAFAGAFAGAFDVDVDADADADAIANRLFHNSSGLKLLASVLFLVSVLVLVLKNNQIVDSPNNSVLLIDQYFEQILTLLLFLFFPVFNALFDYCSWYFSRWLFKIFTASTQHHRYIKTLWFIVIDFTLAFVFLVGLLLCLPVMFDLVTDVFLVRANSEVVNELNWRIVLEDFRTDPLSKGFWVTGMLFSTLIPTALHLIAVLLAPFSYYYHDKLLPYVNAMQYQDSHKQWHINHAEKGAFILLFTAAIVFPQVAVVVALWLLWQGFSLEATVNLLADGCLWLHELQYSNILAITALFFCIAAPWLCDKLVKPFKDQFPQS